MCILDQSDQARIDALTSVFLRYNYPAIEAETRACILYFMQIGYNSSEPSEPMAERLKRLPSYLLGFSGREAPADEEESSFSVLG